METDQRDERDFLFGQLLIAMPNMGDARFEHSVVLICTHDADHAMGVIVNKRLSNVDFTELLDQLDIEAHERAASVNVFFGGPVQTERGIVLHSLDYRLDKTIQLSDEIGLTATKDILVDIGGAKAEREAPSRYMLVVGHAGWGAGQLEQEIAMNAWAHCEADEQIIFDGAEDDTWKRALSKLGVTSAMFSGEWANARGSDEFLN